MKIKYNKSLEFYLYILLVSEITQGLHLSQRELSRRLGIAVGLVNFYLKKFVSKGYLRIKKSNNKCFSYIVTPKGLAKRNSLAYQQLADLAVFLKVTRQDFLTLFRRMQDSGIREVVFCGVDITAEVAYLSLRESGLALQAVVDNELEQQLNAFFGLSVFPLDISVPQVSSPLVITSLKRQDQLLAALDILGVQNDRVFMFDRENQRRNSIERFFSL